jgi:hypothetical protein
MPSAVRPGAAPGRCVIEDSVGELHDYPPIDPDID